MIRVAFLDRDGVINIDKGYVYKWEDFEYCYKLIDALRILNDNNFKIIIVTNQSGIARGLYTEKDYIKLTNLYLNDFKKMRIDILDVFYCPHHPEGTIKELSFVCDCRKPKSGMLLNALKKYNIDINNSFLAGDSIRDIIAGQNVGIRDNYLITQRSNDLELKKKYKCFNNLFECVLHYFK